MFFTILRKLVPLLALPSYGCPIGSDSSSSIPAKSWLVWLQFIWLFELEKNVLVYDESRTGFRDNRYFWFSNWSFLKPYCELTLSWWYSLSLFSPSFPLRTGSHPRLVPKALAFKDQKIHHKILLIWQLIYDFTDPFILVSWFTRTE